MTIFCDTEATSTFRYWEKWNWSAEKTKTGFP